MSTAARRRQSREHAAPATTTCTRTKRTRSSCRSSGVEPQIEPQSAPDNSAAMALSLSAVRLERRLLQLASIVTDATLPAVQTLVRVAIGAIEDVSVAMLSDLYDVAAAAVARLVSCM
jgi:hypothetical protein